ncbi:MULTISPECIES: UDP-N-acetylmuramate--L-alanine ligase [Thalassospira]|jgi:UDP-N-acetylmuramate--alanine ligase|uniref:UDP-N-acetylmuramate--L-alanine ligase n=1 Tax=Thalassospira povalilytica TaxID=732237 RepID=A0A8I1SIV3_9PROT|nr:MULTISPECIES: UDP-N-acetylmuramate--L-alanine ligase [Thalassospira]KZB59925.1 UDP-N-acetylmuramate--alanine ligase [Thalassospira sp. MCCC 1A02491]MAL41297.1 UDP-N-acetylmuramate--L-alanine ligase [Thalassospira sp.]MBN8196179.1 UDP-N-acetylmuramate--L-alanine ligase [Thalassospira povalilytica]MBO6772546.1 UDP-N-acetylmuramate--L-alanine ligase [Thalassospira sp.]MCC4242253.1 UDP-N-acetylmuramate--L-alanine ligase [Thalassospira povalilytica]|tara:strand:- start:170 stop:1579 length:1410 start_codon:yes stop_codon:yes gene_type:complete
MNTLPLNIGTIHFVGIGGIGMSGIAEILHNLGYSVQGSDISDNANVQRLRDLGITVFVGHQASNVEDAKVVVISTAVKPNNPEVVAARAEMIPVVRRSEMLAELMRLKAAIAIGGTHGKTTTTSLVATMLDAAGLDPTVINGGIINSYGTNARLGEGDWMVVEADESDGTFVKVPSTISVVTNIDPEHLDHWKDFDQLREAFKNFVQNIPFYGFAVLCIDHPEVQALIGKVTDRRIFTFGFSPQADVRAVNVRTNIGESIFDVVIRERVDSEERVIKDVRLPMVGDHNVSNSLAAITVALELGIPDDKIVSAFDGFTGVKRRFTKTGEVDGVTIIDDYGHHPVEIKAVLKAARQATQNNVIAVVQPHRYSRLHDLFEDFCTCFNDADSVIVADVYEAGESPIEGASRDALVEGLRNRGHRHVSALEGPDKLAEVIRNEAKPGDLVVCLGAGSISAWANALPAQLEALKN